MALVLSTLFRSERSSPGQGGGTPDDQARSQPVCKLVKYHEDSIFGKDAESATATLRPSRETVGDLVAIEAAPASL